MHVRISFLTLTLFLMDLCLEFEKYGLEFAPCIAGNISILGLILDFFTCRYLETKFLYVINKYKFII